MTFLSDMSQCHYVIHELQLPYCTVCTPIEGVTGSWHTPILCEESSDDTYSLFFAKNNVPQSASAPAQAIVGRSRLNGAIHRCVTSESVTSTKLKGGKGLASRGTISLTMSDKRGDPGPIEFTDSGTFFGKLVARNILEGKKLISHFYSVGSDGVHTKVDEMTHYVTVSYLSKGKFTLKAKDALKDLEAFSTQYPEVGTIELDGDIDDSQTSITVTDNSSTIFLTGERFVIGSEIFKVVDVGPDNEVIVDTRGTGLSDGTRIIYKTVAEEHSDGSTIQPCVLYNGTPLADAISQMFVDVGLGQFRDTTQWEEEIEQWDGDAFLYGVLYEPGDAADVIDDLLSWFMVDMWLDQKTQLAKISTNSPWKDSSVTLSEGSDIQDLTISTSENTRYSQAYVWIGKEYQTESDETTNYSRAISETDIESEGSDYYGSSSVNAFGFAPLLSAASGRRLTSRFIQRYSETPREISFNIEERKAVDLEVGSVVNIVSREKQSPGGEILVDYDRVQIMKMQPALSQVGRKYKVSAMAYVPLFTTDPTEEQYRVYTDSTIRGINLASEVNAPTDTALNYTFVFDNCTIGSAEEAGDWLPAITAGAWDSGSRIRIILTGDTRWSAKGGGALSTYGAATDGYDCYESSGIETEIYLNYTDIDGHSPEGELFAAGGAGGGLEGRYSYDESGQTTEIYSVIRSGGGGSGIPGGTASTIYVTPQGDGIDVADNTDGGWDSGGDGGALNYLDGGFFLDIDAGDGGVSVAGQAHTFDMDSGGFIIEETTYNPTNPGYAVTGGNVTIYDNSAGTVGLKSGQSVAGVDYTLITS